jgi:hypothetical protein
VSSIEDLEPGPQPFKGSLYHHLFGGITTFLFALPFGAMPGPSRNTTPYIVRVRGRYRVGKPLGFRTFGAFVLRFASRSFILLNTTLTVI